EVLAFPAGVAARLARILATSYTDGARLTPAAEAALKNGAPLTDDEARKLVAGVFRPEGVHPWSCLCLLLLEAIAGTDVVFEAIVTGLEKFPPKELQFVDRPLGILLTEIGFMLLRLAPAQATATRARLEAVRAAWVKTQTEAGFGVQCLDSV